MTLPLLASWQSEGLMFNLKTHYEQVPLEIVRKIMDEQLGAEATNARYPGIDQETLTEVLSEEKAQSIAQSLTLGERAS
jgi:HEPN domain-containing protein